MTLSAAAAPRRAGRLPAELTSFVGRRAEVAEIRRLLSQSRLVTLLGPGGVGKTRLAVRAAGEMRAAFPDGVCFVDLGGLTEPALLPETLCDALDLPGQSSEEPVDRLAGALSERSLLMVLDTCEHLADACALLAEVLLLAAPGLRILATSRQALDLAGECLFTVEPLARPGPARDGDGSDCESVALFADRAAAVAPGWRLTDRNRADVGRLCHRLDGIPLAIELAVAQLRVLPVEQIVARLGGRLLEVRGRRSSLARHQTLRAAIDWSHELCSPAERLLWARLTVLAGDFDLEVAERVCTDEELPEAGFIDVLSGLIGKSVVSRTGHDGEGRYRMLDTIREYGAERLEQRGEADLIRTRACEFYAEKAAAARRELGTAAQPQWLAWFVAEGVNLRALLEHAIKVLDEERLLPACHAIGRMMGLLGRIGEARYWTELVLATRGTDAPGWTEARILAGLLAILQRDERVAAAWVAEAAALLERCPDESHAAYLAEVRGMLALHDGDYDTACELFEQAGEGHRGAGNGDVLALLNGAFLAGALMLSGRLEDAIARAEQAVRVCEVAGDLWVRSYVLSVWGMTAWIGGDAREAMDRLHEGLRISRDLDNWLGMAFALEGIGGAFAVSGEAAHAARTLGAADKARRFTGASIFGPRNLTVRGIFESQLKEALGDGGYREAYEAGTKADTEAVIAELLGEEQAPAAGPAADGARSVLTRREREIALLVADGLSNRQIAERLVISKRTADAHLEHILAKLGFSSRTQVAAWVARQRD